MTLRDAIHEETGVDILANRDRDALAAAIEASGRVDLETADRTWPQLVDDLLSKYVEPEISNPQFIIDYPVELSPFAKAHRSEPGLVERFEVFADRMEFANAFTELNEPDEQRARFEAQVRYAAAGDEETQPMDEAYLSALEQGMPPTGGVGVGIDRLVMLMTGRALDPRGRPVPGDAGLTVGAPPPSDAAADVVAAAEREARTLRHTRIGTEHLLLGVLGRTDEAGARALDRLGVTLGAARAQVMRIVGLPETPSPPTLPLTPPARDALGGALREAIELGETTVASQHILLAVLRERDSVAVRVLRDAGVAPGRLREEIAAASAAAAEEARRHGRRGRADGVRAAADRRRGGRARAARRPRRGRPGGRPAPRPRRRRGRRPGPAGRRRAPEPGARPLRGDARVLGLPLARQDAQPPDRLAQHARDLHLADPDDLADLGLREVRLEAQPDHLALALRQRAHELREQRPLLGALVAVLGAADRVAERCAGLLVAARPRGVERRRAVGRRRLHRLEHVLGLDVDAPGRPRRPTARGRGRA